MDLVIFCVFALPHRDVNFEATVSPDVMMDVFHDMIHLGWILRGSAGIRDLGH